MTHWPPRCTCGSSLKRHCPETNTTCRWWMCSNAKCVWRVIDLAHGRRLDKDGNVEQIPA